MFHLVSLSLQISLNGCLARALACVWVLLVLLVCWVGCLFLSLGKFDLNHRLIPVVDRPCLALVRQCRKKKRLYFLYFLLCNFALHETTVVFLTVGLGARTASGPLPHLLFIYLCYRTTAIFGQTLVQP